MNRSLLKLSPNVLYEELDDELILLNIKSGEYYTLTGVSSRMWQQLSKHGSFESTVQEIANEFDIDRISVQQDLTQLIQDCLREGLLESI